MFPAPTRESNGSKRPKAPDIQNFCRNKNLIHWMARLINGRRAVSSVQIANDIELLGKFSEMLIGSWLGVEILVNTPGLRRLRP